MKERKEKGRKKAKQQESERERKKTGEKKEIKEGGKLRNYVLWDLHYRQNE